jgi:dipeptidyl-peptidase-4
MPVDLTLQRIAHYPLPGMNVPSGLAFSPDGRLLSYLWSEDGSLVRQLWAYDFAKQAIRMLARAPGDGDSDKTVSAEEALRRERLRMRGFGITGYAWAKDAPVLLVPVSGRLLVSDNYDAPLRELQTPVGAINPQLSPDGRSVAFVRDGELWVIGTEEGAASRQLTVDAAADPLAGGWLRSNGLAEYIAQEEMGRGVGFWWSPDSHQIAFAQVDLTEVTAYRIAHDADDPPDEEVHRYPFAGGNNARVRIGILHVEENGIKWLPSIGDDVYLARVNWAPDGALYLQVENREQQRLDLIAWDQDSEAFRPVLTEAGEPWLNLHDDLRFVPRNGSTEFDLVWSSERTGYRHLYLYSSIGEFMGQLTCGDWPVDRVLDIKSGWVYFLAGKESPLERHIYRVRLLSHAPENEVIDPERLSTQAGLHVGLLSPDGEVLADLWDSASSPPRLETRYLLSGVVQEITPPDPSEANDLGLRAPDFIVVPADDGTPLYGALYAPSSKADGAAPLIVSVYGGPHVQQVANSWSMTVDLRAQMYAREGYAILKLDNRGSARRGRAFEGAIAGHLGGVEVADQLAGVRAVSRRPDIDATHAGIYGWSYGGYMTLMCMFREPEVFVAGVAGAPVTDWDGYDTHYTERYLGTPQENPTGYEQSSAVAAAESLAGALLIVHGMIDENVHFRHSVRLADGLIAARRPFRLLPFPRERHMPRSEEDRVFMETQILQHFCRNLPASRGHRANS